MTGTYLVGTPEIQLGTILNAEGREGGVFSPSYRFAIFKRTNIYWFAAVALLVCEWERRMRHLSDLMV
jgi:hypothetical protein